MKGFLLSHHWSNGKEHWHQVQAKSRKQAGERSGTGIKVLMAQEQLGTELLETEEAFW